ncbi:hypothetical protein [Rufibacter sp. LB8]|uniref:hypothetical protein n=1 Tax=Rufibacter sp. LB8 TaxID=2777781 RepID=UPI001CEF930E|nr:hypothetical protein [Rufibacter sp. LB8]
MTYPRRWLNQESQPHADFPIEGGEGGCLHRRTRLAFPQEYSADFIRFELQRTGSKMKPLFRAVLSVVLTILIEFLLLNTFGSDLISSLLPGWHTSIYSAGWVNCLLLFLIFVVPFVLIMAVNLKLLKKYF